MMGFRRQYGASPLQLLSLLSCFALAGYAALEAARGPLPLRMGAWFVGALVGHDLVLFPLYALADRAVTTALPGRSRSGGSAAAVNYVRVPALLSGLLLLMFFPLILRQSEGPFGAASGRDEAGYLSHWLLISAVLFTASAVLFVLRRRQR